MNKKIDYFDTLLPGPMIVVCKDDAGIWPGYDENCEVSGVIPAVQIPIEERTKTIDLQGIGFFLISEAGPISAYVAGDEVILGIWFTVEEGTDPNTATLQSILSQGVAINPPWPEDEVSFRSNCISLWSACEAGGNNPNQVHIGPIRPGNYRVAVRTWELKNAASCVVAHFKKLIA